MEAGHQDATSIYAQARIDTILCDKGTVASEVKYEDGYTVGGHSNEIKIAYALSRTFGGVITLQMESKNYGEKRADYEWNGAQWELKTITTEKAADMAIRKALKQIREDPGGIVIDCSNEMDKDELIKIIDNRAMRSGTFDFDVIIMRNGEFWAARHYKR